jgi:hypothetical protein
VREKKEQRKEEKRTNVPENLIVQHRRVSLVYTVECPYLLDRERLPVHFQAGEK